MIPMPTESEPVVVIEGDCLDVLPTLADGSVDAVVTDPPYGVGLEYESYTDSPENLASLVGEAMPEIRRVSHRAVLTPGLRNLWLYPQPDHVGCIYQPAGMGVNPWGFTCWQPLFFYGSDPFAGKGSRPDTFKCLEAAENNGHPCPKPIRLWRQIVSRASLPNDLILDPFAGSGTTGVAAIATGRRAILIEKDPRYAEIARRRIQEAMGRGVGSLFKGVV